MVFSFTFQIIQVWTTRRTCWSRAAYSLDRALGASINDMTDNYLFESNIYLFIEYYSQNNVFVVGRRFVCLKKLFFVQSCNRTFSVFRKDFAHEFSISSRHIAVKLTCLRDLWIVICVHLQTTSCGKQDPVRTPRVSNLDNLKSKRKHQIFFALQESDEIKDRVPIWKTCFWGAEVETKINLFINNGFLDKQIAFFHNTDFFIVWRHSEYTFWKKNGIITINLDVDIVFFKKGLKMHVVINIGKVILALWNFNTTFRFAIAIQEVCNSQNPRTLDFRELSSGILALITLFQVMCAYKYIKNPSPTREHTLPIKFPIEYVSNETIVCLSSVS